MDNNVNAGWKWLFMRGTDQNDEPPMEKHQLLAVDVNFKCMLHAMYHAFCKHSNATTITELLAITNLYFPSTMKQIITIINRRQRSITMNHSEHE